MKRRVVVTGVGLVTPVAVGTEETWQGLLAGKSGIGPITHFDSTDFATHFAGEVKGFEVTRWISARDARNLDLFIQYAIASALLAVEDSGLKIEGEFAERVGCYVGAGLGGVASIEETCKTLAEKGPRHGISPFFVPAIIVNLAPGQISIRTGAKGPNFSHVSACSTGAHAIGEAARAIERGDAEAMICGGAEATVSPLGVGGFNSMRALSTRNEAPQQASRPFDRDRDGFVIAEGAGILVIEELEHAKQRGAKIYAEITGYAANADAHHITAPAPEGEGAQRCMRMALKDAKLAPADIGYINAHGTSTKMNDERDDRHQEGVRRRRPQADGQLDEVDDRSHAGGGRRGGDGHLRAGHRPRRHPADHQLHHARSRLRSRLRAEHGPRAARRPRALEQLRLRWHERLARPFALEVARQRPAGANRRAERGMGGELLSACLRSVLAVVLGPVGLPGQGRR